MKAGHPGLGAYLTPLMVIALSFGYAVGWGSFVMPGTMFLPGAPHLLGDYVIYYISFLGTKKRMKIRDERKHRIGYNDNPVRPYRMRGR